MCCFALCCHIYIMMMAQSFWLLHIKYYQFYVLNEFTRWILIKSFPFCVWLFLFFGSWEFFSSIVCCDGFSKEKLLVAVCLTGSTLMWMKSIWIETYLSSRKFFFFTKLGGKPQFTFKLLDWLGQSGQVIWHGKFPNINFSLLWKVNKRKFFCISKKSIWKKNTFRQYRFIWATRQSDFYFILTFFIYFAWEINQSSFWTEN